jgi:hypothetical protein
MMESMGNIQKEHLVVSPKFIFERRLPDLHFARNDGWKKG